MGVKRSEEREKMRTWREKIKTGCRNFGVREENFGRRGHRRRI